MDFKNASLDELKQFVKEHKIKGVSALRKSALIEFLEKNYNGETDHTAEINEAKSQKADAEKKKKPGKTQKKGKTEHTDKSASPDQTVQVKNAEATEQQEKCGILFRQRTQHLHHLFFQVDKMERMRSAFQGSKEMPTRC